MAHLVWILRRNVSRWLAHVNLLLEVTVQECCIDVNLFQLQVQNGGDCADCSQRFGARYWRKSLLVIDSSSLRKTLCAETRFIALVGFHAHHPFAADRLASWRKISQFPRAVLFMRRHLLIERALPLAAFGPAIASA